MPLIVSPKDYLGSAALYAALFCIVALGPMVGVVHPPATVGIFFVSLLSLVLHVTDRVLARRRVSFPPLIGGIFGFGALLSAIQLLPLPPGLHSVLSPHLADQRRWVLKLLPDMAPTWQALSPDVAQTGQELLRLLTGLFIFIVLSDRCRRSRHRRSVFRAIIGGGLLTLLVSLSHRVANAELVWGLFRPTGLTPLSGPLVNPNHLARLLGVSAIVGLGYGMTARGRQWRSFAMTFGVFLTVAVFLTLSRGGALALVASGILLAVLMTRYPNKSDGGEAATEKSLIAVPLLILVGLTAAVYIAREGFMAELEMSSATTFESSKLAMYVPALQIIKQNWLLGVSTGGLESVFPSVMDVTASMARSFSHVENIFLQTFIDRGVIFGAMSIALCAFVGFSLLKSARTRRDIVPLTALAFLIVGDVFDFFLEIGAGTILAATLLALASGRAMETRDLQRRTSLPVFLTTIVGLSCVGFVCIAPALSGTRFTIDAELRRAQPDKTRLEEVVRKRPHDGYISMRLAADARKKGNPRRALQWANRAMILWPNLGAAHIEAARAFRMLKKKDQALLEYKLAWTTGAFTPSKFIAEMKGFPTGVEERLRAVPLENAEAVRAVCRSFDAPSDAENASICWETALENHGGEKARLNVINKALEANDPARAEEMYKKYFLGRGDTSGLAFAALARLETTQLGLDEAYRRATQRTVTEKPAQFFWWQLESARKLGRTDDALMYIAQLRPLAQSPKEQNLLDEYAVSFFRRNQDLTAARQRAELWTRRAPRSPKALCALLTVEVDLKLIKDAQATAKRAVQVVPEAACVVKQTKRLREILFSASGRSSR